MKKFRNVLVSLALVGSFASCAPPLIEPTPSPSASISSTSSPMASFSPTPSPTPTPAPGEYRYDIPLLLSSSLECSPSDTPKAIYEIKSNGIFTYYVTENNVEVLKEKKLSSAELSSLRDTLQEINLSKLAESDEAVKPGAPQTEECRTIETFYINVNGKDKSFDRNGRKLIHTKEYFEAINKLKSKLEDLKNASPTVKYAYSIPLKISTNNECSGILSERVLYEVNSDRTFNYIVSENDLSKTASRKLTDSEFNQLKETLRLADISTLSESDVKVDSTAPQTRECRTIENYQLLVNGASKTYDKNGRQYSHTKAYLDALINIKNKLVELAMK
ncbi:MAG: hypothetical protein U0354_02640 [Candidatus Sericytochromatia bacterium]